MRRLAVVVSLGIAVSILAIPTVAHSVEGTHDNVGTSTNTNTNSATGGNSNVNINQKYYAPPAMSIGAAVGTESFAFSTIIGGISSSATESYIKQDVYLRWLLEVHKMGLVNEEEFRTEVLTILQLMKAEATPKRIFGIGPRTRGKHLLNLFGIIATDSWRD